ncbi:protease modulator HflC [PVC group bacterium]|nr:protease modulator HflC [PVC group bacterium]
MKKYIGIIVLVLFIVFALLAKELFFIVQETDQVIVTQFGKPVGEAITTAGLRFKLPWQKTIYFEKRVLRWDGDPKDMPTKDKRNIFIDTTARWQITDPLLFYQAARNINGAAKILDGYIDAATREVISKFNHVEAIRSSNRIIAIVQEENVQYDVSLVKEAMVKIEFGRDSLTALILKNAAKKIKDTGITLIDVKIKRINYIDEVLKDVYRRMIAERNRIAEKYRSEGKGQRAKVEGQIKKELQTIQSQSYRKVQVIRGKADAEALKIYADAYGQDPDFYGFLKTLETYEQTLDEKTTLILGTNSEYFRLLKGFRLNEE